MSDTRVQLFLNVLPSDILQTTKSWCESQHFISGQMSNGCPIDRDQLWFHKQQLDFHPDWNYERWKCQNDYPVLLSELEYLISNSLRLDVLINSCLVKLIFSACNHTHII